MKKKNKTKALLVLFKNTIVALLPLLLPQFDFKLKGSQAPNYRIFEEFSDEQLSVI